MDHVDLPESNTAASKVPVDKTFRPYNPDQVLLLPPSLDDWLPAEHLARFVAELVDEHLDLSRIRAAYTEGRGAPPFGPRLMVRLFYTTGVRSPRAIEKRCVDDVPFRWRPVRRRTTGRSPGSASGICRCWCSCSCRR